MYNDKIDMFRRTVLREASERKNALEKWIEEHSRDALKNAENEALLKSKKLLHDEIAKVEKDSNIKIAKVYSESKRKLIGKREEIIENTFDKLVKKVDEYRKSVEYSSLMLSLAKKASERTGEGSVIYIDKKDKETASMIFDKIGTKVEFGDIFGGVKSISEKTGLICDLSFVSKMTELKESFLDWADLSI